MNQIKFILIFLVSVIYCNRLPTYVGVGYDLAKANPKADKVDPGFRSNIFVLNFNQGLRTEDGRYQIPDDMVSRNRYSCSYGSSSNQYTGTSEYQKELQSLVSGSGGYDSLVKKASFSVSSEFKSLEESTRRDHSVVAESGAKCEVYSLEMGYFDSLDLSSNFKTGILQAFNGETQWERIIENFGTHYIVSTILGGRTHLQHKIKNTDYQELRAMGIDVSQTTKFKFAKWSGDINLEWRSYEKQVNTFESKIQETKEIYIGGKPPKSGDWKEWQDLVATYPAPVEYRISSISDLFTQRHFNDVSIENLSIMRQRFNDAVDRYCSIWNCRIPEPDIPVPPEASAISFYSESFGGWGGWDFTQTPPSNPITNVRQVRIRAEKYVDQMQFLLSDSLSSYFTPAIGGLGGRYYEWNVPENEYIYAVEIRHAKYLDGITFITNKGNKSPYFGGYGGYYTYVQLRGRLVGIFGKADRYIDRIGFITNEIKYN